MNIACELLKIGEVTAEDLSRINLLANQLSEGHPPVAMLDIAETLRDGIICIARDTNAGANASRGLIVGMCTMVCIRKLHGHYSRIEDIVVEENYRGNRIAEKMIRKLIDLREHLYVDLESHPSRQAAHRLYKRMGFQTRDTSFFRLPIG